MRAEYHENKVFINKIRHESISDDEGISASDIIKRAQASLNQPTVIPFPTLSDIATKHRRSV